MIQILKKGVKMYKGETIMRFTIAALLVCLSSSLEAHAPVINDGQAPMTLEYPFDIEAPEHSKAIFSELKSEPHYYKIVSQEKIPILCRTYGSKTGWLCVKANFRFKNFGWQ